ncbi:hypothetical protein IW150_003373, partial [Coemansia sp. RSA 2607]
MSQSTTAGTTLHANRACSSCAAAAKGRIHADTKDDNIRQAEDNIDSYLTADVADLEMIARPVSKQQWRQADDATTVVSEALEADIVSHHGHPSNDNDLLFSWLANTVSKKSKGKQPKDKESSIYPLFSLFVRYVATQLERQRPSGLQRAITVNNSFDVTIKDSESNTRPDIILECADLISDSPGSSASAQNQKQSKMASGRAKTPEKKSQFSFKDIFAVVEAKRSSSDSAVREANIQLFQYTREVYDKQLNRRNVWGATLYGNTVRVSYFGPDYVLSSAAMDLLSASGRRSFIRYLVNWSFCERHCLGYDPTIEWMTRHQCWKISAPTLTTGKRSKTAYKMHYYYAKKVVISAEHMFGRLTRCFLARKTPPANKTDLEPENCEYAIKDAWVESTVDAAVDTRDEISHLVAISDALKENQQVDGMYPKIVAGGRVQFSRGGAVIEEDTTMTVLRDLYPLLTDESNSIVKNRIPFRAHKRIVTEPVAMPLRNLESGYEVIIVIADAMRCHGAIVDGPRILHRDMSMGNIMFTRNRDKTGLKGLLIDFDHAINLDRASDNGHKERTGTGPFMSVNNLEKNDNPRSRLDDCESVLYILSWIATFGLKKSIGINPKIVPNSPIKTWDIGAWTDIAGHKRDHLHSEETFELITKGFHSEFDGHEALYWLITKLRRCLIEHGNGNECTGTKVLVKPKDPLAITQISESKSDPFKARVAIADDIYKKIQEVLDEYA